MTPIENNRETRAAALLAANGFALVKTMEFVEARPELASQWLGLTASLAIPLLGAYSAYRVMRLPPKEAAMAEATAIGTVVLQTALWVGLMTGYLGA